MNTEPQRVAVVTGASRGIGRCIALRLAERGVHVALNFRGNVEAAEEVAERARERGVQALLLQADISVADEARGVVAQAAEHFGRVDYLVNNAGITRDRTLAKLSDDDWEQVLATNLGSVYYTTRAAMPVMIEQNYGRIVNITSFVGQAGNFGQSNYSASKGGIIAFTKTAALELARHNITVNAIAPGFTETDMLATVPENIREKILQRIPLGRFGDPDEVARMVAFVACEGDYITGQQINVNGGVYMF